MKAFFKMNILLLSILAFASCAISPDYNRPEVHKKEAWSEFEPTAVLPSQIIQTDWWTNFNDPYLNELITEALSGSLDLRILAGRIQEAEITIKQTRAGALPSVNSSANTRYSRGTQYGSESFDSKNTEDDTDSPDLEDIINENQSTSDLNTNPGNSQYINASLDINWEIDIWGKNKNDYLATKAEYKASEADYRAGYLKLVSDVANAYFQLCKTDEQVEMSQKFYADNREKLDIYKNQYSEGLIPEWKVSRQEAEVKSSEQGLLELDRNRKRLENGIAVLLGRPAGEFKIPKTKLRGQLQIVRVPAGIPSDLLSRRPDIVAAEYRVLKAHHQIAKAKADRLPSISFSGNGGFSSSGLSSLLSQWTLGFGPRISLPIFDAGRREAQVAMNEMQARSAENRYRQTIMKAFEEVENALINLDSRSKQKAILEDKVRTMRQVRAQTIAKFEMGLISQLEILDIERELFTSEKSLLEMHRSILEDTVTLFKALGGGWPKETVNSYSLSCL